MNINTRHMLLRQKHPGSTKTVEGVTSSPVLMDPGTTPPAAVTQPRSLDTRGEAPAHMMATVIFHIKNSSHIHILALTFDYVILTMAVQFTKHAGAKVFSNMITNEVDEIKRGSGEIQRHRKC